MYQDFGRRLERDINKFVTARLDATRQITGQEVNVQDQRTFELISNLISAKAHRRSSDSASDAEIRSLVRRKYAGIHGNYSDWIIN